MLKNIFNNLNYLEYCEAHKIHELKDIELNIENYGPISKKKIKKWETVDPSNKVPSPAELDDLIRIHYLIRLKKTRVVLEFGVGKSTSVILDALKKNKDNFGKIVEQELRVTNPFQLHSVDNNIEWLERVKRIHDSNSNFNSYLCEINMGTFMDKFCTYYDSLPNVRPDFIYLDAPDQFSVKGEIRGFSTRFYDRMPMAADLLAMEHFLEPGAIILVDGRTANARFLKSNFQRSWDYHHFIDYDQHIFVLDEPPLGKWNEKTLNFVNDTF